METGAKPMPTFRTMDGAPVVEPEDDIRDVHPVTIIDRYSAVGIAPEPVPVPGPEAVARTNAADAVPVAVPIGKPFKRAANATEILRALTSDESKSLGMPDPEERWR